MPFLMYVHAREPWEPDPDDGRRAWQPSWRLWRWVLAALVVAFAAGHADGAAQALLVFAVFGLGIRALGEIFDYGGGLSEWRQ
ncbi:MAG TPA: hypothetical protein VGF25_10020 [Thermoleophilaceae bacterium]|jgi:hypothetical protein